MRASGMATLAAIALLLAGAWGALYAAQRRLLFPAPGAREAPTLPAGTEVHWLESDGARVETWFLPAAPGHPEPRPLIIYAHGNGELIDGWVLEFQAFRAAGISILLVEYPGYGRSTGEPSERSIARIFSAAYDLALESARVDARRVVGWGRSLGGGAVCALARQRRLAALVLESSFSSVRKLARALGVPRFLVRDPFDNLALVRAYRGPLLLLHGEQDASIPVAHARELHAAAPGSELHVLHCGHNDCPRDASLILRFLARAGLLGISS